MNYLTNMLTDRLIRDIIALGIFMGIVISAFVFGLFVVFSHVRMTWM